MRSLRILHIEDSEDDAILFARACEMAGLPVNFCVARSGSEGVAYLKNERPSADGDWPPPDLIVLDLNMPGLSGFEFLKWLRQDSRFGSLPVLVFTASARPEDKSRALEAGASGYFIKPRDFETLVRLAESFRRFQPNENTNDDDDS
jgi:two-component system response regulator